MNPIKVEPQTGRKGLLCSAEGPQLALNDYY